MWPFGFHERASRGTTYGSSPPSPPSNGPSLPGSLGGDA